MGGLCGIHALPWRLALGAGGRGGGEKEGWGPKAEPEPLLAAAPAERRGLSPTGRWQTGGHCQVTCESRGQAASPGIVTPQQDRLREQVLAPDISQEGSLLSPPDKQRNRI